MSAPVQRLRATGAVGLRAARPATPVPRAPGARSIALALLLASLAGCGERARPTPMDPGLGMSVEVVDPAGDETIHPGALDVTVHGNDPIGRLNALGVVVRTAPAPGSFVDSVVVHFPARIDNTVTVTVQIPRITKPAGMELRGLALNITGGASITGVRALTVIP